LVEVDIESFIRGMTKYRKGPTKEHYTGPQRIGNTAKDQKGALHRTIEDRQS